MFSTYGLATKTEPKQKSGPNSAYKHSAVSTY